MFIGYLIATIRLFKRSASTPYKNIISKEGQQMLRKWIKALIICMVALGIVWPATVFIPYVTNIPFGPHYYPIELGLVLFIYWIAFAGYYRTKLIYFRERPESHGLSVKEAKNYLSQLQEAMETRKLYLDPELTLEKFSEQIAIPAKTISLVLNHHVQSTFNTFVNQYRINEVKKKLSAGDTSHLTISGIALDSGFNSQATFQRVFKNMTGITPKQFLSTTKNVEYQQE
jgi:AraC-like DNA-binding protein